MLGSGLCPAPYVVQGPYPLPPGEREIKGGRLEVTGYTLYVTGYRLRV